MARLTHIQKVRLARRLITQKEISAGVSIWDSVAWQARRKAHGIAGRINPHYGAIQRALAGIRASAKPIPQEAQKKQGFFKRVFGRNAPSRQKVV